MMLRGCSKASAGCLSVPNSPTRPLRWAFGADQTPRHPMCSPHRAGFASEQKLPFAKLCFFSGAGKSLGTCPCLTPSWHPQNLPLPPVPFAFWAESLPADPKEIGLGIPNLPQTSISKSLCKLNGKTQPHPQQWGLIPGKSNGGTSSQRHR